VTGYGRICFQGQKINLSRVFAGQNVGVTQGGECVWLVTFMQYDLGYFDDETCRLEPIQNPFGPTVLPMSSECAVCRQAKSGASQRRGRSRT
jgi:putative transposase